MVHITSASRMKEPPRLPPGLQSSELPQPPAVPLDGWTPLDILLTFVWAMLTYESILACMLLLRAKKPNPNLPAGQNF